MIDFLILFFSHPFVLLVMGIIAYKIYLKVKNNDDFHVAGRKLNHFLSINLFELSDDQSLKNHIDNIEKCVAEVRSFNKGKSIYTDNYFKWKDYKRIRAVLFAQCVQEHFAHDYAELKKEKDEYVKLRKEKEWEEKASNLFATQNSKTFLHHQSTFYGDPKYLAMDTLAYVNFINSLEGIDEDFKEQLFNYYSLPSPS